MPSSNQAPADKSKQVVAPPLPLEWTRQGECEEGEMPLRYPWDVIEINQEEEELVVVGTAGQKITKMGSDLFSHCNPKLKQLVLRSHMIQDMEGIAGFKELELLELYDNQITKLQELNGDEGYPGKTIRTLDMSYNVIRDMSPVQFCPNLRELYLANNKLKTLDGLGSLTQLRKIDLGDNRIRVMDEKELSGLVNLEELWLGKNKIEKIEGLEKLTKLRRLDVQSNRLREVENLATQVDTLEELYLAHNAIDNEGASKPTGLGLKFTELTTLDLSKNSLTSMEPFAHLVTLEELWLSSNKIASFDGVQPLSALGTREGACLEGIYLEYNPVADDFEYRKKLAEIIPCLKQIDATMVGGIVAQGMTSVPSGGGLAETYEAQMQRLQQQVIERARAETEIKKQG